MSEADPLPSA